MDEREVRLLIDRELGRIERETRKLVEGEVRRQIGQVGRVRQCAHCKGTGVCKAQEWYEWGILTRHTACRTCWQKAGLEGTPPQGETAICSVCGGKGEVYIGPEVVQIRA